MSQTVPFFISIPHSGEKVPPQTPWLAQLPEVLLMSDVDRYVDRLYQPVIEALEIPSQKTEWHRYAIDLNRIPADIDQASVIGAIKKAGSHPDGYHWVMTKHEEILMPAPMTFEAHRELTHLIYEPFHLGLRNHYDFFKKLGFHHVFQLDVHSMPSKGTRLHRDPDQERADVVISDCSGVSCDSAYRDLVIAAYAVAGFRVGYNWPYMGGRVTEQYGQPQIGQHAIQIELNRRLYMDEATKQILPSHEHIQQKLSAAVAYIKSELPKIKISL